MKNFIVDLTSSMQQQQDQNYFLVKSSFFYSLYLDNSFFFWITINCLPLANEIFTMSWNWTMRLGIRRQMAQYKMLVIQMTYSFLLYTKYRNRSYRYTVLRQSENNLIAFIKIKVRKLHWNWKWTPEWVNNTWWEFGLMILERLYMISLFDVFSFGSV